MQTKVLSVLAILSLALVYLGGQTNFNNLRASDAFSVEAVQPLFNTWSAKNNFQFTQAERTYRLSLFTENYRFAEEFNKSGAAFTLGMTPFAAMTLDEFKAHRTTQLLHDNEFHVEKPLRTVGDVPSSIDWTQKGAVAPVENQGSCGSCWAFSTKGGLEGFYALQKNTEPVPLSAQQFVDCSKLNLGCNGGDPMTAYRYAANKGIQSQSSYPYVSGTTGKATTCTYSQDDVIVKNGGQVKVSPTNQIAPIQAAAAQQPVTIEVSAGNIYFQLYTGGIIDSAKCPTALDHGVLLTGYNMDNSTPYWLIKNSWGESWGESGYVKIAAVEGAGICGIQQYAAYPTA